MLPPFLLYTTLTLHLHAEAEQQLRVHGRNELEEKHTSKLLIFLKLVSPLVPMLYCLMGTIPYILANPKIIQRACGVSGITLA